METHSVRDEIDVCSWHGPRVQVVEGSKSIELAVLRRGEPVRLLDEAEVERLCAQVCVARMSCACVLIFGMLDRWRRRRRRPRKANGAMQRPPPRSRAVRLDAVL
jgi:hypothetical protein